MFVLATAAIGAGLFGLGLHGPRERPSPTAEPAAAPTAHLSIRPLPDRTAAAGQARQSGNRPGATVAGNRHRGTRPATYREPATPAATMLLAQGDLAAAFREHCRAMHVLLRTFNSQRHKEEVFQPVWDKHVEAKALFEDDRTTRPAPEYFDCGTNPRLRQKYQVAIVR